MEVVFSLTPPNTMTKASKSLPATRRILVLMLEMAEPLWSTAKWKTELQSWRAIIPSRCSSCVTLINTENTKVCSGQSRQKRRCARIWKSRQCIGRRRPTEDWIPQGLSSEAWPWNQSRTESGTVPFPAPSFFRIAFLYIRTSRFARRYHFCTGRPRVHRRWEWQILCFEALCLVSAASRPCTCRVGDRKSQEWSWSRQNPRL